MTMHADDQKYGFMREWMLTFSKSSMSLENHFEWGVRAWELLQKMPEGSDKDQDELFKFSPR